MIQWQQMEAKIPLLAKWDSLWQCLSQTKVPASPHCVSSSYDVKKRRGYLLDGMLMVEALGIGSTYRQKTTAIGLQWCTIDVSHHRSLRLQPFSLSHFLILQTTSAKHWNRQKGTTTGSLDSFPPWSLTVFFVILFCGSKERSSFPRSKTGTSAELAPNY